LVQVMNERQAKREVELRQSLQVNIFYIDIYSLCFIKHISFYGYRTLGHN